MIHETKSLLKGASHHMNNMSHLYAMDGSNASESSSSYESEGSDDDASVSSKASVASKASRTIKKLGGKLRGSMKVTGKRRDSGNKHAGSTAQTKDYQADGSESDSDDESVSSRASAVERVKAKCSLALKVVVRRRKSKEKSGLIESGGYDSDSSLSSEEDLFLTPTPTRGPHDRAPVSRGTEFHHGDKNTTHRQEKKKKNPLRRLGSTGNHCGPRDIPPVNQPSKTSRRHTSPAAGKDITAKFWNEYGGDIENGHVSDLSDDEEIKVEIPKGSGTVYQNNWSMNVTEEMLKEMSHRAA